MSSMSAFFSSFLCSTSGQQTLTWSTFPHYQHDRCDLGQHWNNVIMALGMYLQITLLTSTTRLLWIADTSHDEGRMELVRIVERRLRLKPWEEEGGSTRPFTAIILYTCINFPWWSLLMSLTTIFLSTLSPTNLKTEPSLIHFLKGTSCCLLRSVNTSRSLV